MAGYPWLVGLELEAAYYDAFGKLQPGTCTLTLGRVGRSPEDTISVVFENVENFRTDCSPAWCMATLPPGLIEDISDRGWEMQYELNDYENDRLHFYFENYRVLGP